MLERKIFLNYVTLEALKWRKKSMNPKIKWFLMYRKEMEKQRMEEWEKQRRNELEQHRQRETEKVLMLRAKKETLNTELENAVIFFYKHRSPRTKISFKRVTLLVFDNCFLSGTSLVKNSNLLPFLF